MCCYCYLHTKALNYAVEIASNKKCTCVLCEYSTTHKHNFTLNQLLATVVYNETPDGLQLSESLLIAFKGN